MSPMPALPCSKLAMNDLKHRLYNLGMISDVEDDLKDSSLTPPSSPPYLTDHEENVSKKSFQSSDIPGRADAVVPTSGAPFSLHAVFIKSSEEDMSSKLSSIWQHTLLFLYHILLFHTYWRIGFFPDRIVSWLVCI